MYGTPLRFSMSSDVRYNSAFSGVVSSGASVSNMAPLPVHVSGRFDHRLGERRRLGVLRGNLRDLLDERQLDDQIRRPVGIESGEQRHRHVVDRHASGRSSFGGATMRVPMKDGAHAIAVDRFFETAGS